MGAHGGEGIRSPPPPAGALRRRGAAAAGGAGAGSSGGGVGARRRGALPGVGGARHGRASGPVCEALVAGAWLSGLGGPCMWRARGTF